MPLTSFLNVFRSNSSSQGAEENEPAVIADASVEVQKPSFEWNVSRIYSHQAEHSEARTWTVRILSTVLVFPVVLTLIADLGRRLAFSVGLVDGKSWSLIDKTQGLCKALSDKVSKTYSSVMTPKVATLDEKNRALESVMKSQVRRLVDGYRALNGGWIHTNSSFSAPKAINGEMQIRDAQIALAKLVNKKVIQNSSNVQDFIDQIDQAEELVERLIQEEAGTEIYIGDKVRREGQPPLLHNVVLSEWRTREELQIAKQPELVRHFIEVSKNSPDFSNALAFGIKQKIITESQARAALQEQAERVFVDKSLVEGFSQAEDAVDALFQSAKEAEIVDAEEAIQMDQSIQPGVEILAQAAARSVVRKMNDRTTDAHIARELVKSSDVLKHNHRLNPEDESEFVTKAKAMVLVVKEDVALQEAIRQQEAERLEAERAMQAQAESERQERIGKFSDLLSLIESRQRKMRTVLNDYSELNTELRAKSEELRRLNNTTVTVKGNRMTALDAIGPYYRALAEISRNQRLTAQERLGRLQDEGFAQTTIDLIQRIEAIRPRLTEIAEEMARLANDLLVKHKDLLKLNGMYQVYRKNHIEAVQKDDKVQILTREKTVKSTQDALDRDFSDVNDPSSRVPFILRPKEKVPVNIDPEANQDEVEALIEANRDEIDSLPAPRSLIRKLGDGIYNAGAFVLSPVNSLYSWIRA